MAEEIEVRGPTFDRTDDREPHDVSEWDRSDFETLRKLPEDALRELGLQPWSKDSGLWLFPAPWYDHIPEGFEVTTINDRSVSFDPGETSDDRRYGALAYGVVADA